MQGSMVDLKRQKTTSGKRNFIEQNKGPIYLKEVFLTETI